MKKTVLAPTPFGPVVLLWSLRERQPKLCRILLSRPGVSAERAAALLYPETDPGACRAIDRLCAALQSLLHGRDVRVSPDLLSLERCSPFQQAVLRAEQGVPRGRVTTYGRLAVRLRRPTAARAVGRALAANPFPLIIPCHRAIQADRSLGGFQGGSAMKRALLEAEGVAFDPDGRVSAGAL